MEEKMTPEQKKILEDLRLPKSILERIEGKPFEMNDTGKSGAPVLIFDDSVLKIVLFREENEEVVNLMRWLKGKLPTPEVILYEKDAERQYLLMSKVTGTMSCNSYYLEHPDELLPLLAEGLQMLWKIDTSDCPRIRDLDAELKDARYNVEHGLVDMENAEPTTFGEGGFKDPAELLDWLENHRPSYEPVFSHGDFCLPNILIKDGKVSGYIDMATAGVGDKWRDIALCYRSFKHNMDGTYGGKVYSGYDPDQLFEALGIEPDREKIRYYLLLDELF